MARLPLVKHIVTIGDVLGGGGTKYSIKVADIYADFNGATGVVRAPANDNTIYEGKITSESFSTGQVIKLKARASNTSLTGQKTYRDFNIISTFDKAKNAIANLDEKSITAGGKTWNIESVRIPRRVRLS
jgi:hypothetical protein